MLTGDLLAAETIQRLAILAGLFTFKGELMSKSTLTVYLPDRDLPLCIEADGFKYFGCELVLEKDGEIVGRSSDRGFVFKSELLRKPSLEAGTPSTEWVQSTLGQVATAEISAFHPHPAPLWPLSMGMALGVLASACVAGVLLVAA